jgi:hypothetical protein
MIAVSPSIPSDLPVSDCEVYRRVAVHGRVRVCASEDQRTVIGERPLSPNYEKSLVIKSSHQPEITQQYRVVLAIHDLFQSFYKAYDAGGTSVDHEHAVLDTITVGFQLLGHTQTPRVIHNVVGDEVSTAGVPAHRMRIPT